MCCTVVQHLCDVQWYSIYVCSSGTAPVCHVQWYRTFVFSTVVQCCDTADANTTQAATDHCRKHCSTCLVQQVANNTPLLFSGVLQLFLSFVLFLFLNRTHCYQLLVQTVASVHWCWCTCLVRCCYRNTDGITRDRCCEISNFTQCTFLGKI